MLYTGKLLYVELYDTMGKARTNVKKVWESRHGRHPGHCIVTNAHWFDPGPKQCGNYKVDGVVLSNQWPGALTGFGWNAGALPEWTDDMGGVENFVCTIPAFVAGERQSLEYEPGVCRAAARTWLARCTDGEWCAEVTSEPYTLEEIAGRIEKLGGADAMIFDGSGSSQAYDGETHITGDGREIYSYLLLWFEQPEQEKEEEELKIHQQFATKNKCYITGAKITPCGVMVHSTGANNPNLKRYVQPDDGLLGANPYGNSMNEYKPGGRTVCPHAFIGKLADGSIAAYQILPWDMEGWHAGGEANALGYIGFEICEDGLSDPDYFNAVYREAVELTAYLCNMYGFDPHGYNEDGYPYVLCHSEGYMLDIASNHGDVMHWFPRHGKSMDTFRADVAIAMQGEPDTDYEKEKALATEWVKEQGISDGTRPYDPLLRVEYWVMLYREAMKEDKQK